MLCMTSDYASGTGCPEPHLRRIAKAGFSHVHWCHQWCTDFLYTSPEIEQIKRWLSEFGLSVCDVHASHGQEKSWGSRRDYERLAGLDLIRNRAQFAEQVGANVVILHLPPEPEQATDDPDYGSRLRASIDALLPDLATCGVRLAFENMIRDNFPLIASLLREYGPDQIGLCYDSGHGNLNPDALDCLDALKDRLIAVHLHDNNGQSDQHLPPFHGTLDWSVLARIIAASNYAKPLSFETAIRETGLQDEDEFLAMAHTQATALREMVDQEKEVQQ